MIRVSSPHPPWSLGQGGREFKLKIHNSKLDSLLQRFNRAKKQHAAGELDAAAELVGARLHAAIAKLTKVWKRDHTNELD